MTAIANAMGRSTSHLNSMVPPEVRGAPHCQIKRKHGSKMPCYNVRDVVSKFNNATGAHTNGALVLKRLEDSNIEMEENMVEYGTPLEKKKPTEELAEDIRAYLEGIHPQSATSKAISDHIQETPGVMVRGMKPLLESGLVFKPKNGYYTYIPEAAARKPFGSDPEEVDSVETEYTKVETQPVDIDHKLQDELQNKLYEISYKGLLAQQPVIETNRAIYNHIIAVLEPILSKPVIQILQLDEITHAHIIQLMCGKIEPVLGKSGYSHIYEFMQKRNMKELLTQEEPTLQFPSIEEK